MSDILDFNTLAEAARTIDALAEESESAQAVFDRVRVDPSAISDVAIQRALRAYGIYSGQIKPHSVKVGKSAVVKADMNLVTAFAAAWVDGLTTAMFAIELRDKK